MKNPEACWTIVGQGLAGACLAWELWKRRVDFRWVDPGKGGSSRIAAGMINPVTGKNFEPSWRIEDFLPEALAFYRGVEETLGRKIWYPLPVLRLAGSEKEWRKICEKMMAGRVGRWVGCRVETEGDFVGGVEVVGGGRLDVPGFLEATRDFFVNEEVGSASQGPMTVWCEGAAGLLAGKYGAHRSAKGEILTLRAEGWDESRIRVGGGGWLVPLGNGIFKAGANYEWDELDEKPTEGGRAFVERILARLGEGDYEVIAHEAGVRPILRKSQPLIGPLESGGWMFNGLGSKGSLYAPGMARRLADWMIDGREADAELDFRKFSGR